MRCYGSSAEDLRRSWNWFIVPKPVRNKRWIRWRKILVEWIYPRDIRVNRPHRLSIETMFFRQHIPAQTAIRLRVWLPHQGSIIVAAVPALNSRLPRPSWPRLCTIISTRILYPRNLCLVRGVDLMIGLRLMFQRWVAQASEPLHRKFIFVLNSTPVVECFFDTCSLLLAYF